MSFCHTKADAIAESYSRRETVAFSHGRGDVLYVLGRGEVSMWTCSQCQWSKAAAFSVSSVEAGEESLVIRTRQPSTDVREGPVLCFPYIGMEDPADGDDPWDSRVMAPIPEAVE